MSRLTKRENGDLYYRQGENYAWSKPINKGNVKYPTLSKLAHYEDLEEQGKLIELPCAVGDMVYVIAPRYVECDKKYNYEDYNSEEYLITWCQNYCPNGYKGKGISPTKIEAIHIIEDGIDLSTTLGRYHIENVFTTREEAEAKLSEMEVRNE